MSQGLKVKVGTKIVDLNQNHYKGAGGEGTIYVRGSLAYKIYHDPKKMIPVGKIKELKGLALPNVLAPLDTITDTHDHPIGFVMQYVDQTEFLTRLFTKGFRDQNGIDPSMVAHLVKRAQDTLKAIHAKQTLVVDYNEMNFLASQKFDEIYHIDVDCYQTPSYPATALMESVRDRQVKNNKFTELSDWFSFAVVMFQLYMGTHPYKGRHPDYKPKDWMAMMDKGISVFNPKCKLPPNTQDWSVIPAGHRKWFEAVFEKGERTVPPNPDQVAATAGQVKPQIIASTDQFLIAKERDYSGDIKALRFISGIAYALTTSGCVYADQKLLLGMGRIIADGYSARRTINDFCYVQGLSPVRIEHKQLTAKLLVYQDFKEVGSYDSTGYFVTNDRLYNVLHGSLIEFSFFSFNGKDVVASQRPVANVFQAHTVYDGMIAQDILRTCHLTIPYKVGEAVTIRVKELDALRIASAKREKNIAIVIAECEGQYNRYTFVFDKSFTTYTLRKEENVALEEVNFVVLDKGVTVAANSDNIEVFVDNTKIKVIGDSPLTSGQKLYSMGNTIYVTNKNGLFTLKMK